MSRRSSDAQLRWSEARCAALSQQEAAWTARHELQPSWPALCARRSCPQTASFKFVMDPHKATYVAKDTKSGLVIMRHQESERLRELCEWIRWGVIDGRVPSAND